MLIYSFAFVLVYFLAILFAQKINISKKETNVNECNEKSTTETINHNSFEWETKKKFKKIISQITTGETRCSCCFSSYIVIFVPQSFMWRCSRSFLCSQSKRLQRVFHTTRTTRANICVLSKLTWHLCKWMHLHFSSQHLHIT